MSRIDIRHILKYRNDNGKLSNEDFNNNLRILALLTKSNLLEKLEADEVLGLTEEKIENKREKLGYNVITNKKKDGILYKLYHSFINPFSLVLIFLAVVSFFTDYYLAIPEERSLTAVIIILTMVTLSGVLRFVQEGKSTKAGEKLKAMINTTTSVLRNGTFSELPISELMVGDIVKLAAGDMIPADIRILSAKDLFISQSSMTGESEPVEKFVNISEKLFDNAEVSHFEFENLAYMGTNTVSGSATGVVIGIGNNTYLGKMSDLITEKRDTTSFDKGVNSVSWILIRFMMFMVPVVFVVNGLTKGNWLEALLFAISIAVGLTPEMLPMIVTTNLAKGAVVMSQNKTIVKNLNAIQNFGAMNLLCTDKTGTLTEDHIVLERHLNVHGVEDLRVLKYGYLNSYFQTGLKNLLDIAILTFGAKENMSSLEEEYEKIDEIPFDFQRRRMSVVLKNKVKKSQIITKGAVEEMISICTFVEYNGAVVPMTEQLKNQILETVYKLNEEGLRVIAIAKKSNFTEEKGFTVADENEMVLIGYIGFLDPPKESAAEAIKALFEYGVDVKVLTGDNEIVTKHVCQKVGIEDTNILLGSQIDSMSDDELKVAIEKTHIFAKLSPQQKARVVSLFRENGHVVGFMGDGINDAPAMRKSDVAISVDTAVDIAKECADIILLEKDLMVLERGVIQGRKTFANIIKYIKMTASSNFGNMFSILIASAFLPFLPMMPTQILLLNLIYDNSCIVIPWDNVDEEYLKVPRKWESDGISKFMLWIGPTSSVFDITTYALMYFVICPMVLGGSFNSAGMDKDMFIALFNTGWFVESLWTQTLVIHMIRTPKIPFIQSIASKPVMFATTAAIIVGTVIPYTPLGPVLGFSSLPPVYYLFLMLTIGLYIALVSVLKKMYIKKYGRLL
ncbi:MAG: magnesium-translocating P-type ATPase [Fusobacteriaceae bacterium]